ncbi:MAG: hypothetical protein IMZ53_14025 [Thermoplasmata archaeon]|nr:hypothetical protein [Thermoplasmata archaeon]
MECKIKALAAVLFAPDPVRFIAVIGASKKHGLFSASPAEVEPGLILIFNNDFKGIQFP